MKLFSSVYPDLLSNNLGERGEEEEGGEETRNPAVKVAQVLVLGFCSGFFLARPFLELTK